MRRILCGLTTVLTLALVSPAAFAADHRDGPESQSDPATDINDVYTFMNETVGDEDEVIFIVTIHPEADDTSRFSDAAEYHLSLGNVTPANAVLGADVDTFNITCTYNDTDETVTCVPTGDFDTDTPLEELTVDFNAADPSGDVGWRIWAGLRDDPFFFDLEAFQRTTDADDPDHTPGWFDDEDGDEIPNWADDDDVDVPAPENFFATLNTLAIVVGVDRDLIDGAADDTPVVRVWASARRQND